MNLRVLFFFSIYTDICITAPCYGVQTRHDSPNLIPANLCMKKHFGINIGSDLFHKGVQVSQNTQKNEDKISNK